MENETVTAKGISGASYTFVTYRVTDTWNDVPVVYMFARREGNTWNVAYIGQADSAKSRLPNHERWQEAARDYRATHVLARVSSGDEDARKREERDLIQSHNPPMNVQHKAAQNQNRGRL